MSTEVVVALIVGVLAVLLAWLQLRASLYVRRREFEDIYVQRYWEISDRLSVDLRVASYRGDDLPPVTDPDQRRAIWDYLALCEDQIDLRRHGDVTDEAWDVWSSSITGSVNRYPYSQFFDEVEAELAAACVPEDQRPFEHLRAYRTRGADTLTDPLRMSRWHRYFTGRRESLRPA